MVDLDSPEGVDSGCRLRSFEVPPSFGEVRALKKQDSVVNFSVVHKKSQNLNTLMGDDDAHHSWLHHGMEISSAF